METFFWSHWLGMLITGLLGLFLGWLLFRGRREVVNEVTGVDADVHSKLQGDYDALQARYAALESDTGTLRADVDARDTEIGDLKAKLAAGAAGAAAAGAAAIAVSRKDEPAPADQTQAEDEAYALEWRNRYLAARVKYLESRLSEAEEAKEESKPDTGGADMGGTGTGAAVAAGAAAATAAAVAPKPKAPAKASAKAASKPKVLYTDGPTDGPPDDLKKIKGIGPKFEGDLNSKGIYYYRQIGAWKKADVKMVEGVIDSIPGRIDRDEWVRQAKGLAKGAGATKVGTTTATKAATRTTGAKAATRSAAPKDPMDRYMKLVNVYDVNADRAVVERIVKYAGVAMRSRDTSLVACSDPKERERIVKGFASRKLKLSKDEAEQLVADTCLEMKPQRQKNRVVFYYVMAQKADKLEEVFGG